MPLLLSDIRCAEAAGHHAALRTATRETVPLGRQYRYELQREIIQYVEKSGPF